MSDGGASRAPLRPSAWTGRRIACSRRGLYDEDGTAVPRQSEPKSALAARRPPSTRTSADMSAVRSRRQAASVERPAQGAMARSSPRTVRRFRELPPRSRGLRPLRDGRTQVLRMLLRGTVPAPPVRVLVRLVRVPLQRAHPRPGRYIAIRPPRPKTLNKMVKMVKFSGVGSVSL